MPGIAKPERSCLSPLERGFGFGFRASGFGVWALGFGPKLQGVDLRFRVLSRSLHLSNALVFSQHDRVWVETLINGDLA